MAKPKTFDNVKALALAMKRDIIAKHDGVKERQLPKGFNIRTDKDSVGGYAPDAANNQVQVFTYNGQPAAFLDDLMTELGVPCCGL